MNFINLIKVAVRAIANNKFRSFLSMLGIIIGVAAVIVMMAIGQGSKESIRQNLSQMGTNIIMIRPGADKGMGGVRQDPSSMQTLKEDDYKRIKKEAKYVTYVSPEVTSSGQCINGNNNTSTTMYGESVEYLDIKQWEVTSGSVFTDDDIRKSAKVCVVGKTVVDELFGEGVDPVGKTVRFKSIPFRVIGVLKSKGYNSFGMDQDNLIIAPYTTVMKRLTAQTYLSSINCSAITEDMTEDAIDELTTILREQHKIKEEDESDFTIRSQQEMMETMSSTMDTVTLILVVAAAFSCLKISVAGKFPAICSDIISSCQPGIYSQKLYGAEYHLCLAGNIIVRTAHTKRKIKVLSIVKHSSASGKPSCNRASSLLEQLCVYFCCEILVAPYHDRVGILPQVQHTLISAGMHRDVLFCRDIGRRLCTRRNVHECSDIIRRHI